MALFDITPVLKQMREKTAKIYPLALVLLSYQY